MVYQGEAFCPGHVTAFFEVCEDPDPRRKGSRGAGLSLTLGVRTVARVRESPNASLEVFVNERKQRAEVTERAVAKVLTRGSYEVKILSETPLPVSQGFGVSAAAALSTILALDDALGLGTPRDEIVSRAHETEVECGTGLGDVTPASLGGMDLRLEPGAPPHGVVKTFEVRDEILLAVMGPEMPTRTVLRDRAAVAAINRVGSGCVRDFAKDPTLPRLFDLGNRFAVESGIAGRSLLELIRASRMFGRASMALLGNAVFAAGDRDQLSALYRRHGTVYRCEVDREGARVL